LNNVFKSFDTLDKGNIHALDGIYKLFDKIVLLITVLDERSFFCFYTFTEYQDIDSDRSMIRG